jgi:outer membrane immunogenic protein
MFKSLTSAAALALALSVGSAFAADLPSYKSPPPPPPPPPPMWTGFYIGLNAGYTWSGSNSVGIVTSPLFFNPLALVGTTSFGSASALGATGVLPVNTSGFIGGGQIGYNWQFGNRFVAGVEADIQGVAGSNNRATATTAVGTPAFPGSFVVTTLNVSKRLDYLGTVRGRLGFLVTPTLLVYGTGGLAYGGVNSSTTIAQAAVGPATFTINAPYFGAGAFSDTRVGWTAGGGGEWMFLPNWSAKVEYLYYNLGNVTYSNGVLANIATPPGGAVPTGGVFYALTSQSTTRYNGHIVRAGLNYHFNWGAPTPAVYAKY